MRNLVALHGKDQFEIKILYKNDDAGIVWWQEQSLIKQNISNPLCLNGFFIDPDNGNKVFSQAGIPKSSEHRKKLSEANKGKHSNPEAQRKAGLAQRGKKLSEVHKDKLRKASTGFRHSEEAKRKISLSGLGKTRSSEVIAKMSAARKGIPASVRQIEWLRKSHLGVPLSDAHRAKIKQAQVRRRELGTALPTITCPHCGKTGITSNMRRWHFENCKHRPDVN